MGFRASLDLSYSAPGRPMTWLRRSSDLRASMLCMASGLQGKDLGFRP